jgi:hypothetical protein
LLQFKEWTDIKKNCGNFEDLVLKDVTVDIKDRNNKMPLNVGNYATDSPVSHPRSLEFSIAALPVTPQTNYDRAHPSGFKNVGWH